MLVASRTIAQLCVVLGASLLLLAVDPRRYAAASANVPVDDSVLWRLLDAKTALITLETTQNLGMFEYLEQGPQTAHSVAAHLGLTVKAADAMLILLSSYGLLLRCSRSSTYSLAAPARAYLLKGSHFYINVANDTSLVGHIPDNFITGAVHPDNRQRSFFDRYSVLSLPDYYRVMRVLTAPAAVMLGQSRVFDGVARLLDVGGGDGTLSIGAAMQNPRLEVSILEQESVCPLTRRNINEHALQRRVVCTPGNFFHPLPQGYDAMMFGNVLHNWDDASAQALLHASYSALKPGGRVLIHERLLETGNAIPTHIAAAHLRQVAGAAGTAHGERSCAEFQAFLLNASFVTPLCTPMFGNYVLVSADKAPMLIS